MIKQIHDKNLAHLDLKPQNIVMDKDQNPNLIDFETLKSIEKTKKI